MKENGSASDKPLDNVILNRMRGFAGMNKLKKEALKVIATGMSPEEIAGLKALFVVRLSPITPANFPLPTDPLPLPFAGVRERRTNKEEALKGWMRLTKFKEDAAE